MKRFLPLLVAAFLLLGCEGPMGPMGPDGPTGAPGEGTSWDVSEWTVNKWTLSGNVDGNGSYYYADLAIPELTSFIANKGNVFVYKFTNDNVQAPLPYVTHKAEGNALWTETYDFDFTPGSIRVYVQYSDFKTSIVPPSSRFRVVMNW
ncbi:hypothetical protein [uncultured Acetobacteroides sp.]|uniref:hypothetical protein n=1 Tax=uncultured Acetobacteroides sp. TaxID=1760811 RepID=UPI0029F53652|nr:hypothetical protein [uncultured Acetobacteroides sp.]